MRSDTGLAPRSPSGAVAFGWFFPRCLWAARPSCRRQFTRDHLAPLCAGTSCVDGRLIKPKTGTATICQSATTVSLGTGEDHRATGAKITARSSGWKAQPTGRGVRGGYAAPPSYHGGGNAPALLPRRGHRCEQRRSCGVPPPAQTRRTAAPGHGCGSHARFVAFFRPRRQARISAPPTMLPKARDWPHPVG
jgi:hypothetical protein